MEIKTTLTQKRLCRKCKSTYLSIDHSKCPSCSKKNKELAAKRSRKKNSEDQHPVTVAPEDQALVEELENSEG